MMTKNFTKFVHISRLPIRLTSVLIFLLGSLLLIFVLVTTATPDEVGPLGVTTLFILVFVVLLSTLTLLKMIVMRTTVVTMNSLVSWALIPTLFLGLGTLKQLTIVDVALVIIFATLLGFYIKRATSNSES